MIIIKNVTSEDVRIILWRIDPLLSSDFVESGRC
jgi:hypothetical protein